MAVFHPIEDYISYGKISAYLAANSTAKNKLFKSRDLVPSISEKIEIVRKAVEWKWNLSPSDESLNDTALYLYALCGRYVLEARRILNQGIAGQLINPSTGTTVTVTTPFIQFRVGEPGALMVAGDTSLTLEYENVINPSVEVFIDGVALPYGRPERLSYTVNYVPDDNKFTVIFNIPVETNQLYWIRFLQLINVGIPASIGGGGESLGGIFVGDL